MSEHPGPRVPIAPLLELTGGASRAVLSEKLSVTSRTIQRWRQSGIPIWEADRAAIRLGTHPAILWPDVFGAA